MNNIKSKIAERMSNILGIAMSKSSTSKDSNSDTPKDSDAASEKESDKPRASASKLPRRLSANKATSKGGFTGFAAKGFLQHRGDTIDERKEEVSESSDSSQDNFRKTVIKRMQT